MIHIIEDKKYDTNTSIELHSVGSGQAISVSDGACTIYKTKKGNVWAVVAYWPNSFGSQKLRLYAGVDGVIKALKDTYQLNYLDDVAEAIGYEIEEA